VTRHSPIVRGVSVLFLTGAITAGVGILYSSGSLDSESQDRQPVPFNHARHAGQLKVDCLYCHRFAAVSSTAGVPSVQLCMSCHANLNEESAEAQTVSREWHHQNPIPWVRLQRLPDFVYFSHEMHVRAEMKCTDCHGHVERMSHTPRAPSYEMGWCLTCHRQRGASLDCLTCHQ
jgi:hypothetical protein